MFLTPAALRDSFLLIFLQNVLRRNLCNYEVGGKVAEVLPPLGIIFY